ncbi:hypothetical protein K9857_25285 [Pseudomonas sp. REP124]|uniref:hypothetical protein n=1 Tax=Pseudomonas sp. REP124 TaxID=2875731 RepID=UPI001CC90CF5|nr:hypothetical protein [Pseudomonas sp. REP124]MBZ9784861.1 hypothetical protein [Pseudomonas sp. REP124]
MFNSNKKLDLPPQLQWKYTNEPELLGWTIRARNYNTFVANCMFAFMSVLAALATCFVDSVIGIDGNYFYRILIILGYFIFLISIVSSMTHQRMNFAYRFTQSGVEYCKWKDFPKWMLPFLKWFTGITAVIFIGMASIDPAFLIGALVGPGGMGLMYLSMANSKSYQEMHTQYHHYAFKWEELTQLAIATNREVVDLKYSITLEGEDCKTNWSLNVFCKRKQKEKVAEFIKPYLSSGVPFIKAKVNVPLST